MFLIDAEQAYCTKCEYYCNGCGHVICDLKEIPKVDAVPVIRCKQCRFWDESKKGFSDECVCRRWSTAGVADYFTEPESFCSYADMKD